MFRKLLLAAAPVSLDAPLLTVTEIAARLQISEKSVRRRIRDGIIHKAQIGGRTVRISSDELQRLIAGTPLEEACEDPDIA